MPKALALHWVQPKKNQTKPRIQLNQEKRARQEVVTRIIRKRSPIRLRWDESKDAIFNQEMNQVGLRQARDNRIRRIIQQLPEDRLRKPVSREAFKRHLKAVGLTAFHTIRQTVHHAFGIKPTKPKRRKRKVAKLN